MPQATTIHDLIDVAQTQQGIRYDYRAGTKHSLIFNEQAELATRGRFTTVTGTAPPEGPAPLKLTKHALGQMAQTLGIAYGRAFFGNNPTLPPDIVADTMNHFLAESKDKDLLIRQYGENVRGVLSNKYMILDHDWVLQQALTCLTDPFSGKVADHMIVPGWRIEPDYMQAKIMLRAYSPDDGSDGRYGLGAAIRNGTVGNASTGVASVIMRTACTNSIVERRADWTVRHVGSTEILALKESLIIAAFVEAFDYSKEMADAMIRARNQRLPNVFDVIDKFVEGQHLPGQLQSIVAAGTEQSDSLFGLVNGITYAAQKGKADDIIDADTAEDLEAFGGLLLSKFADGEKEGDALARALFKEAQTSAHVLVGKDA